MTCKDPSKAVMSKNRILKNVLLLSAAHFLVYQAGQTLANLQSTLNAEDGIGLVSLAVQYGLALVCILFLSEILVRGVGCKKMLVLMFILQLPSHAANFYPVWETMIPAAALSGVTLGLVLMGASLYINEMSVLYHSLQDSETLENVTSKFYGIFTFFALNASIWGNLMSYYALKPDFLPPATTNHTNLTCGIDFEVGSEDENDNLQAPEDHKRYVLVGVCLSSAVLSIVLVAVFLDELELEQDVAVLGRSRCKSVLMSLSAAVRHAFVPDQLLLLPLSVFFGMESAFFTADITKAYVACSWGMYHIGFVTMCYGVCGAIMGSCVGSLVKYTSQVSTMVLGACINLSVMIFICVWNPSPNFVPAYFIVAGLWGTCDAIWWSQLGAVYGLLFPDNSEAAFSVMYFCVFLGFTINYSTSNYLSMRVKIALLFSFLVIGMAGYLIGQIKIRLARRKKYSINS